MVVIKGSNKLKVIFGLGAKRSFASRRRRRSARMRCVNDAIAIFDEMKKTPARNFQNYLRKHRFRIPDYQLYQEIGICIGSGSVESWIKQIASRVKIVGAQWNPENVSQILRLRCADFNKDISLGICA